MRVCSACNGVTPKFRQVDSNLFFCDKVCQFDFIQGGGKREREESIPELDAIIERIKTNEDVKLLRDELFSKVTTENAKEMIDYIASRINSKLILLSISYTPILFSIILNSQYIDVNVKNDIGQTLLMILINNAKNRQDYVEKLIYLLLKHPKFDVNARDDSGYTALMYASKSEKIFKMILNHPNTNVNLKDKNGRTAFFSLMGKEKTAKMIFDNPTFDVNIRLKKNFTYLMSSVKAGFDNITRMLLTHPNIDVNAQSENGNTALKFAIDKRNERMMIEIGAHPDTDFFIRTNAGYTVFDYCPSDMCKVLIYAMIRNQSWGIIPKNVSKLLNLRRLRDYLCENLSNQANRADLVVLATFMKLPVSPNATKSDICRDISDVLSAGHWYYNETTFKEQKAKRSAQSATILPILDIFRERIREIAGIDPEGKTLQQLLDELNRIL
jgi:ankyrin repeat protein